tara:strand:- start:416 stop:2056 length:1641 start_codon:yes stop_codon:yes gene_type:complete
MSNQISNLLKESQASFHTQRNETKGLVSKWNKTGLLEGIEAEYDMHNTAILLENQAKQLISEASSTGGQSSEEWNGVALPLVRRIFGEIAAKDFVSVQPMNLPSGLVFWLDFKYGSNAMGAADANYKQKLGTDILGDTSSSSTPTGGLYGKGNAGFSTANTSSINVALGLIATASHDQVGWDGALLADVTAGKIKVLRLDTYPAHFDEDSVSSVTVLAPTATHAALANVVPNVGLEAYNYTEAGKSYFFVKADAGGNPATPKMDIHYGKSPDNAYTRGDFEDGKHPTAAATQGTDLAIPQIDVSLRQEALVAKTRKLKVVWTPEFAQDLNAYHSIDAEAELTSMLSEYISMEIDMEILEMITDAAIHTEGWNATVGKNVVVGSPTITDVANLTAYTQQTWFQTLGTKLQKVSNKIHASTMRGGANFVVASPDVCTILESLTGFGADTDGLQSSFAMGVTKVGAVNNRYTVYKNPYWQDNVLVMGFRGSQFLETGAVYAPYIPLIMTPLVYDPTNFTPRKGVMTRYAKKVVRPEFYGKILIGGLDTI